MDYYLVSNLFYYKLKVGVNFIGRDSNNQIRPRFSLLDGRHAVIVISPDERNQPIYLFNLSFSGTHVNNSRIFFWCKLKPSDIVTFGRSSPPLMLSCSLPNVEDISSE